MTRFVFSFIIFIVLSLVTTDRIAAQVEIDTVGDLSGVEILTSIDRTESYVGDLINYTVTITYDSIYELTPPPLGANLGAFEVKDYNPDVITELEDGRISSQTNFVLSSYVTGEYVIPALPVIFMLPDSTFKLMVSEALPITVLSLLGDETDSLSLKGPGGMGSLKGTKPPFVFKRDYTKHYIFGALGLLLLLGLGYYLYWRKYLRLKTAFEDPREPWEIALEKLAVLKERRFIEEKLFKPYYVDLTELTREFLGRVYKQDALEMTTEEFALVFVPFMKPETHFEQTIEFMKQADLVKFARKIPAVEDAESDYLFVHELISDIRDEQLSLAEAARLAEANRRSTKTQVAERENV